MRDMFETRLKTSFWVTALVRKSNEAGYPCMVTHKGYEDTGTVLIKLCKPERKAILFNQTRDIDGNLIWDNPLGSLQEFVEEREADLYIKETLNFDSDVWVLEIEDFRNQLLPPSESDFWPKP